jgi:hypothetical protein
MPIRRSTALYIMIPLLLLVTWLAARGAAADAIWYDEWWTMNQVGITPLANPTAEAFPLDVTLQRLSRGTLEPNPPGYYLVVNLWSRLTGNSGFALRALSLFGAVLALACAYRGGLALHSRAAGLFAAVLLGTSAFFITYAHEARTYALLMMFTALMLLAYKRGREMDKPFTRMTAALLFIGTVGMLYAHYMALPVLGGVAVYHVFTFQRARRWWQITALMTLAGLTLLPWLPVTLSSTGFIDAQPAFQFYSRPPLELLQRLLARFSNESIGLLAFVAWFALKPRPFVLFVGIVGTILALIINALFGFITDVHYMLALFPVLALIAGVGVARIPFGRGVIVGVWMVGGVWLSLAPPRNLDPLAVHLYLPWREAQGVLAQSAQPNDHLVFALPAPDPNWLHSFVGEHYLYDLNLNLMMLESLPENTPEITRQQLADFSTPASRLWLLTDPAQPPPLQTAREVQANMSANYLLCTPAYDVERLRAALYVPLRDGAAQSWTFGDGIMIDQMGGTQTSRGRISVSVRSRLADAVPRSTYSVGLHIEDAQGALVAQADAGLPDAAGGCIVLQPTAPLPSAAYALYLTVYAWETGERLSATDAAGDVMERARVGIVELR